MSRKRGLVWLALLALAASCAPAQRSPEATAKARTKRTVDGLPVQSFQTLLADLATIVKNTNRPKNVAALTFEVITTPTGLQQRALDLLGVSYRAP